MRGLKAAQAGIVSLMGMIAVLSAMSAQPTDSQKKQADDVLRNIHVNKGWKDATSASAKPTWKVLAQEQDQEAGVRFDFPAIKKTEWFNISLPVREGSWPQGGSRAIFRARTDKAAKMLFRLNEMPGTAEGKRDRHNEFEAHIIAFDVKSEWSEIEVDLRETRKLWGHDGGNGKLDFEKITGIGFEPADPSRAVRLEVRMLRIVAGGVRVSASTSSPTPKFRIVFNSDRGGDYEIYSMDMDGRNLDRLTRHSGYDLWPAPSPDGQRICWMTNRHDKSYELYTMNADGSNSVRLTDSPKSQQGHPTWSPDGKTIAFSTDRDGDMELYLMDADGSNWKRLTNSKGSDGLPTFSPDGKQIIFVSQRDDDHELYRVNVDAKGLTRLTKHKGLDTMPAWSPDGKTVAFVSDRDGDQAIFLMDPDGKNVRRVSKTRVFEGWPDWSPDGRFLCFHADVDGHFTICVVELATGRVEQLTRGRGSNRNPRFMKLTEKSYSPPAIPADGLRLVAEVNGYLTSGQAGPNPQKYPFRYRGYGVLDRTQRQALTKPGAVPAAVAKALGQALLWPEVGDQLEAIQLKGDGKKVSGEAKVLHKYGKQGTHVIAVKLEGVIDQGRLTLRAIDPTITGTWDWGGGIARQEGKVEVRFEVQIAGGSPEHAPAEKEQGPKDKPAKDQTPKDAPKEPPLKKGMLEATATVAGYTQATEFNPQKYPFKYTGSSTLDADQVKALGKAGAVPADTTKALLGCLLWPKEGDSLQKASLKSDGKKLTGEVEVLHKYGKQGTHTLKMRLEGTVTDGKVSLKAVEPSVSGTWDSGFAIKLKGGVTIKIDIQQP